jgi:hypothetical protein
MLVFTQNNQINKQTLSTRQRKIANCVFSQTNNKQIKSAELTAPDNKYTPTAVDAAVDPAAWKANPKQANTQANKQINITSNVKAAASPVIDKSFLAPFHNLVQASKQTI